jgi:threonylcarbamoyladenosine tRNA methylthiotransferase MtaB
MELKEKLLAYLKSDTPQTDIPVFTRKESYETMRVSHASEHIRMNLKVQEGCDRFCTYCIIPYVRGGRRSRPLKDAVQEAETLAASGVPELVLTGIHLASYGKDWGGSPGLMDLLEALDQVPGLMRIRMGSLEPSLLSEPFCDRLAHLKHVCPHVHISLQSGCDATLKRMNRRYTTEAFRGYVQNVRNAIPDVTVSTDMIVGFPGETESDFETSLSFAREIAFDTIHVFPFSPRSGTPAARMDGMVPKKEKLRRAHLLSEEAGRLEKQSLQRRIGLVLPVLIEEIGDDGLGRGFSPEYLHVSCPAGKDDIGRIVSAEICAAENHGLVGRCPGKE